jgi:hypothetical protein
MKKMGFDPTPQIFQILEGVSDGNNE